MCLLSQTTYSELTNFGLLIDTTPILERVKLIVLFIA